MWVWRCFVKVIYFSISFDVYLDPKCIKAMNLPFWNVKRLKKKSLKKLLKEFYVSLYCTSANLKNFPFNSFKIGIHFKEWSLKKFNFSKNCFCIIFLYFQYRRLLKHNIWNISESENVIKNCRHGFLLLYIIIYWSKKEQKNHRLRS